MTNLRYNDCIEIDGNKMKFQLNHDGISYEWDDTYNNFVLPGIDESYEIVEETINGKQQTVIKFRVVGQGLNYQWADVYKSEKSLTDYTAQARMAFIRSLISDYIIAAS